MTLSIGGERFETTKSTLSGSSYFSAMLASEERGLPVPKDGVWRVDRAARPAFPYLLAFLRDGGLDNLTWPDWVFTNDEVLRALQTDACYYGVESLETFVVQLMIINGSFGPVICDTSSYINWSQHTGITLAVGLSEEFVINHFPSFARACKQGTKFQKEFFWVWCYRL